MSLRLSRLAWPCAILSNNCVYMFLVKGKRVHSRRSDPVVGDSEVPCFLQVPAWSGDVARDAAYHAGACFRQGKPSAAINRSIDCPLIFYFLH